MASGNVGRGVQVLLRHEVGVDVVVGDGAVLVGAGDPVDTESTPPVVMAERLPQPGGLYQQLHPDGSFEVDVGGGPDVAEHGVGDVGAHVEGGGAGGPVARTLLAADRAPRKGRPRQAELACTFQGHRERGMAPPQRIRRGGRRRVGEHGQHEGLGVPEGVSVVAGPGQSLRRDCPSLGPRPCLQNVEQREAHRLL